MNKPAIAIGSAVLLVLAGWFISRIYEVHSAERSYEIAEAAGRKADACAAARNVAAIYLRRGDADLYREWTSRGDIVCYLAYSR